MTSATLVIRRRRAGARSLLDPPSAVAVVIASGTAGAERIIGALRALGEALPEADQAALDADRPHDLPGIDLGRRYGTVVLGSHLVNTRDADARRALLEFAARHAEAGGRVLLEHHPLDWATTAADAPPDPGSASPGMVEVRRDPPFVSAVSVFEVDGVTVRQPFTARVLSDAELDAALAGAGLVRRRRLGPTWLEAAPA